MINSVTNGQFVHENNHYPWNNVKIAWYQAYTRNPPPNLQTMAWRYLLKIMIFWQKQTKMSLKQPKNDWFLLIFDVFTIKNSSKCFQNVFTEAIDIKKTANISGFKHFRYYSNSIVLFSKWSKTGPFWNLFTGTIPWNSPYFSCVYKKCFQKCFHGNGF